MLRLLLTLILVPVTASSSAGVEPQLAEAAALVEKYCLDCHNSVDATAGLDLETFDISRAERGAAWDTTRWEKMVKRLRGRQMPPADAVQPTAAEYEAAIEAMTVALDRRAEKFPQPGRTDGIRRLSRTEYRNAIRDLLALDIDVETLLPTDQSGHGFDNVTLGGLSPVLLSRHLTAAELISRLAIGGASRCPGGWTFRLPADRSQESHVEGLPFGTRGGMLIEHYFPQAGEYDLQLRLTRDRDEHVEGLHQPHDIDVLIDRDLRHRFTITPPDRKGKTYEQIDDTLVDANLNTRFHVTAGTHAIGVTFPAQGASLSEIRRQPFDAAFNRHRHPRPSPALFQVSIAGPFDPAGPGETPSRRLLGLGGKGDQTLTREDAKRVLQRLVRRAYRRPITDEDLRGPLKFFDEGFHGGGYEAGLERALASILVSPHFLLRVERDPEGVAPGEPYAVSDIELASRLSFFLWSSLPDDALLDLAEAGRLHEPAVLREQTRRMLADFRSRSLVTNFASQWLYLRNLESFKPDMRLFPDFDDNLRQAMRSETERLFERVLRDDRSVLELINSDTTFLNERLARHYNIAGVQGSQFREVKLPAESRRGGLLRQASILAVTSYATRTSPTIRGHWVLGNLLGCPPPPPPPNVPSLKEKAAASAISTVRERLAEHRANPACASCHDLMDPVGFALENYDAVGRWRDFEEGLAIDSSGALPGGGEVSNAQELEQAILAQPEGFVGGMTEKLLTFALGRGVEPTDAPAVRQIVRQAKQDDYRFSSLIIGVTGSAPFKMRAAGKEEEKGEPLQP